jgi:hypothetical protein
MKNSLKNLFFGLLGGAAGTFIIDKTIDPLLDHLCEQTSI